MELLPYVEEARRKAVGHLWKIESFNESFPSYRSTIKTALGPSSSGTAAYRQGTARTKPQSKRELVFRIGEQLSEAFLSLREGNARNTARAQGGVSAAGKCWEALVCWYLNLGLRGTEYYAALMVKDLVPAPFLDAICVNYKTFQANTEADIVVMGFPKSAPVRSNQDPAMGVLEEVSGGRFKECEVGIVQCKTNWNKESPICDTIEVVCQKPFKTYSYKSP